MSKHIQHAFQELSGAIGHNRDHVSDMTRLLLNQLHESLQADIKKAPEKFTAPFNLENGVPKLDHRVRLHRLQQTENNQASMPEESINEHMARLFPRKPMPNEEES